MNVLVQDVRVQGDVDGNGERICLTDSQAVVSPVGRQALEVAVPPTEIKPGQLESHPSSFTETPASSSGADETAVNEATAFPAADGELDWNGLHGDETHEGHAEGDGHDDEGAVALDDAGQAHDDSDDAEVPQPLRVVEPPENFDWRKLKPRVYGKSLPPLDPVERQTLKASIESRGFLGEILIDELFNIIDGNHRWTICMETGIAPAVEMIKGLSEDEKQREWEKEELALSRNLDRRQLDKEDAVQVFEARLDNLLDWQQENPKKWTLDKIAKTLGVSKATVAARRDLRHNSAGGTVSKPDARRKYDDDQKREAVRLVNEGNSEAEVARKLVMHLKAVQRAVKDEKEREAGGSAAKDGKRKKAAAKPLEPMEDIAASDGVPRVHRPAVQDLGLNAHGYMELVKVEQARAREDSKAFADEKLGNLKQAVYHARMAEIFNSRLTPVLTAGGESDVEEAPGDSGSDGSGPKPGDVLRGIVFADEADEVFVALPVGGSGVIDKRNDSPAWQSPPEKGGGVRVRLNGFDSKRCLWDLQLVGRQTAAPAPGAIAAGLDRDERCYPSADLAGRKAGPKKTGVTE